MDWPLSYHHDRTNLLIELLKTTDIRFPITWPWWKLCPQILYEKKITTKSGYQTLPKQEWGQWSEKGTVYHDRKRKQIIKSPCNRYGAAQPLQRTCCSAMWPVQNHPKSFLFTPNDTTARTPQSLNPKPSCSPMPGPPASLHTAIFASVILLRSECGRQDNNLGCSCSTLPSLKPQPTTQRPRPAPFLACPTCPTHYAHQLHIWNETPGPVSAKS